MLRVRSPLSMPNLGMPLGYAHGCDVVASLPPDHPRPYPCPYPYLKHP